MNNVTFSSVPIDLSSSPYSRIKFPGIESIGLGESLWSERRRVVSKNTIYTQYRRLDEGGYLDNFRDVAENNRKILKTVCFLDSDVYKWIEAASWVLSYSPDLELSELIESVIPVIASAQSADGYLNTYISTRDWLHRWTDFDLHELYCAGHCIQAAIAHQRVTGRDDFLIIAIRFADLICTTFGSDSDRLHAIPGHEEIEMAMIELFRVTGNHRYLECARYFIESRGKGLLGKPMGMFEPSYSQDHEPLRDLESLQGHAVRAMYYMCGASDLYAEIGDDTILKSLESLWDHTVHRKSYITGGLGARYEQESFGSSYELPNDRAYSETCAAIGSFMWNMRMLAITGDAKFADLAENTLYNGILPGLSENGTEYFYQNPLSDEGEHRRKPWYEVACCPPNIARALASMTSFLYGISDNDIYINFYCQSQFECEFDDRTIQVDVTTDYPESGDVRIQLNGTGEYGVALRIPAWADGGSTILINGEKEALDLRAGQYLLLRRQWTAGDLVELHLPMKPKWYRCHPYVDANYGRLALCRGPILYCVESADQESVHLDNLYVSRSAPVDVLNEESVFSLNSMLFTGHYYSLPSDWGDTLYAEAKEPFDALMRHSEEIQIRAIPYYAWANRESGQMRIWLKEYMD